ncbi:MAG: DUF5926 family protein [Actinomycetaceae bacterium]|nr:DUF5926 family protein [Actinomycetaceae bacterium]
MGKKSRKIVRVKTDKKREIPFKSRPFEGFVSELALVACRDILPAATIRVKTTPAYGAREVIICSFLPEVAIAFVREDGTPMAAMQIQAHSGDASHDLAIALISAINAADSGKTGAIAVDVTDESPELAEVIDPATPMDIVIEKDFGFWLDPNADQTPEVVQAMEQSSMSLVPTEAVPGVEGAWTAEMNRNFVRWVRPTGEREDLDALARLRAAGELSVGKDSKFVGAFRTCGLLIPVWEIPDASTAADLSTAMIALEKSLAAALKDDTPLSYEEKRARDGIISRQVDIR